MGVFLIILLVIVLLWPWISRFVTRWLQEFMSRRAEDMLRRMMGMPTRKEERRRARRNAEENRRTAASGRSGGSAPRRHRAPVADAAQMLRSVAEDVEFTEIREFDSATIADSDGRERRIYREEQVSDVEFTEIKDPA